MGQWFYRASSVMFVMVPLVSGYTFGKNIIIEMSHVSRPPHWGCQLSFLEEDGVQVYLLYKCPSCLISDKQLIGCEVAYMTCSSMKLHTRILASTGDSWRVSSVTAALWGCYKWFFLHLLLLLLWILVLLTCLFIFLSMNSCILSQCIPAYCRHYSFWYSHLTKLFPYYISVGPAFWSQPFSRA